MTPTRTPLTPAILDIPVRGRGLRAPTLGGNLAGEPTLLVFLRHLG